MSHLRQLMQHAHEMQERLLRELNELVVEASIAEGAVRVKMSGHKHLLECKIDPEALSGAPSMLEDLIVDAVNKANCKVEEMLRSKVGSEMLWAEL